MNNSTGCEEEHRTCSSLTEEIGYLYVIPIICSFGICSNALVLVVFNKSSFRAQMTPSLVIYLTGLTIVDFFNAVVALPLGFVRCIDAPSTDIQHVINVYERYIWVLETSL